MTMPRIMLLILLLNTAIAAGGVVLNYLLLKPLANGNAARSVSDKAEVADASAGEEPVEEGERAEYTFFPVNKIVVSLPGEGREHYFVVDLVLQADIKTDKKKLEQIDPMVRNSAVAHLSAMKFEQLRGKPIPELQAGLEQALLGDFASRRVAAPFEHVLVSKLIVQ
ncbi:flagellar basal body-associated FliL family protein [Zestomonas carbonaria]|uniref:Flagellar protein FliL n=1 Tax=Zestomonas carbonaria TaxID=2762745 RepID=A0A7U7ESE0_9GAMM|nr:flagellar basal body-associated FliL family protein [Pseudomonas carbonaria]CAD5110220.1 Flagellar protein LafL [Pseudomonas carbonaria]